MKIICNAFGASPRIATRFEGEIAKAMRKAVLGKAMPDVPRRIIMYESEAADIIRREVMAILKARPMFVAEINDRFGMTRKTMARFMFDMRQRGLVTSRQSGSGRAMLWSLK